MGDGGGRSPAREKSATAIYSQQALDSRCLRVPFRRRGVAGNRGDGSRRPLPPLGGSLSDGGNGDQPASEEFAWGNANVGWSPIPERGRATHVELLRGFRRTTDVLG